MDRTTRSTCPYCGVGCGVLIDFRETAEGPEIIGVRGDPDHPANAGRLCTKGTTLHLTATPMVRHHQRLLQPGWRPARGAALQVIDWAMAEQQVADRLLAIRAQHGPDAIGFYISGQLLTEDYHAFNKLARGLVGTNHIDSNSRLCMSAAVVGYKQTLGADAPPACYEDLDLARCLFLAGTNTAWAHPVLFRRIEAARAARPDLKIIVVDPRRTETAELADLHLPLRPGTDVALFQGMLHACIWEDWIDRDFIERHTEGFEALKALVRTMTPAETARLTGLKETQVLQAAQWFAQSPASLSLYCMGLNQSSSGTAKNTALIDLHLATGQIGRPGAGPLSLTGQPNAMGGRETGGMATLLPGHRDPMRAQDREEIAALWGCDPLPERPGRTAIELFEAAARGEIRALWIACTNPAQSLPDQALVRAALSRCELVILQEAFGGTATADFADVVLPAATWAEKEGTVTNSERRISRVRAALAPAGASKPDWQIVRDVAVRMEAVLRPGAASLFGWERPQQLWEEHRAATRGRDLDISGLSYERLEAAPQQWPFPEGAVQGLARLYEDRRFAPCRRPCAFCGTPLRAACRAAGCVLSAGAQHGAAAGPVAWHEPQRHRATTLCSCAIAGLASASKRHRPAAFAGRGVGAGRLTAGFDGGAAASRCKPDAAVCVAADALGQRVRRWAGPTGGECGDAAGVLPGCASAGAEVCSGVSDGHGPALAIDGRRMGACGAGRSAAQPVAGADGAGGVCELPASACCVQHGRAGDGRRCGPRRDSHGSCRDPAPHTHRGLVDRDGLCRAPLRRRGAGPGQRSGADRCGRASVCRQPPRTQPAAAAVG